MLLALFDRASCARAAIAVAAALSLAGCVAGTPGELGNGRFVYTCDGPSDPACDTEGWGSLDENDPIDTIPGSLAVGSTFQVALGNSGAGHGIVPVAPDMIAATGTSFEVKQPGHVALLARAPDGFVIDLVHVDAEVPDGVQLDTTSVELASAGESQAVRAVPVHGSVALYGALPCQWTIADDSVASILYPTIDNVVAVVANAPGTTTLHLSLGELSYDLPVQVGGQP